MSDQEHNKGQDPTPPKGGDDVPVPRTNREKAEAAYQVARKIFGDRALTPEESWRFMQERRRGRGNETIIRPLTRNERAFFERRKKEDDQ